MAPNGETSWWNVAARPRTSPSCRRGPVRACHTTLSSGCATGPSLGMDDDVAAAFAIADEFLRTFNALDAAGHAATLGYPHVRLASGTVRVWETIEDATAQMTTNMSLI